MKVKKPLSILFYPCPAVLVTCLDEGGSSNIITLAWAGVACSDPPTIGVGIRPSRHSYKLLESSGEFAANIPTLDIVKETNHCGQVSGKDHNKFAETKLTPEKATKVKAPLIKECPVNLECTLQKIVKIGSHDLFLGQVIAVHVEQDVLNESGRIDYSKAKPFVYNQGEYYAVNGKLTIGE